MSWTRTLVLSSVVRLSFGSAEGVCVSAREVSRAGRRQPPLLEPLYLALVVTTDMYQKARATTSTASRAHQSRRIRGHRLRCQQVRRCSNSTGRLPFGRKVYLLVQDHKDQIRSCSILFHHTHRNSWRARIWRCRDPNPRSARYHRGCCRGKGQRSTGHLRCQNE